MLFVVVGVITELVLLQTSHHHHRPFGQYPATSFYMPISKDSFDGMRRTNMYDLIAYIIAVLDATTHIGHSSSC
jgi:hypothetical protein